MEYITKINQINMIHVFVWDFQGNLNLSISEENYVPIQWHGFRVHPIFRHSQLLFTANPKRNQTNRLDWESILELSRYLSLNYCIFFGGCHNKIWTCCTVWSSNGYIPRKNNSSVVHQSGVYIIPKKIMWIPLDTTKTMYRVVKFTKKI